MRTKRGEGWPGKTLVKAIEDSFPEGISSQYRKAIIDYFKKSQKLYKDSRIRELKEKFGIAKEVFETHPYYIPYVELGEIYRRTTKPYLVSRHLAPISKRFREVQNFDEFLNHVNIYGRWIEPNLPLIQATDLYETINYGYRKQFTEETLKFIIDSGAGWKIPTSAKTKTKKVIVKGINKKLLENIENHPDILKETPIIDKDGFIFTDGKQYNLLSDSLVELYPQIEGEIVSPLKFANDTASIHINKNIEGYEGTIRVLFGTKRPTPMQIKSIQKIVDDMAKDRIIDISLEITIPKDWEVKKSLNITKKIEKRLRPEKDQSEEFIYYKLHSIYESDIPTLFRYHTNKPKTVTYSVPLVDDIVKILRSKRRGTEGIRLSSIRSLWQSAIDNQVAQLLEWKANGEKKELIEFFEKTVGLNLNNPKEVRDFLYTHTVWEPYGETTTFIPQGKKYRAITKKTPKYIVDEEIASMVRSVSQTLFTPELTSKFINFLRILNAPFKLMAVGLYPYFSPKYYQTDFFQIFKGGIDVHEMPLRMSQGLAIKLLHNSSLGKILSIRIGNEKYPIKDLYKIAEKYGILGRTRALFSTSEQNFLYDLIMNHLSPMFIRGAYSKIKGIPYKLIMHGDDVFRLALFIDRLNKTASAGMRIPKASELKRVLGKFPWEKGAENTEAFYEASAHVLKHMYHYQVSPFVQKTLKPFIPFIAWYNENIPEMIRMYLFRWDMVYQIAKGRQILQELFPLEKKYRPGYAKDFDYEMRIPIENTDKHFHIYFSIPMPYKDLNRFIFSRDALASVFAMGGVLTAFVSAFLRMKFFPTAEEYKEGSYVEAPVWSTVFIKMPWGLGQKAPNMWAFKLFPETG
ncbi:MAG: hypothetical protein NC828_06770, partial [Candidatus Omnitrophica bacterium]|nr:hypothetical protein [Candidatus Omnitrophota bacterium]